MRGPQGGERVSNLFTLPSGSRSEIAPTGRPSHTRGLKAKQVRALELEEAAEHDRLMAVQRARVFERYGVTPQVAVRT